MTPRSPRGASLLVGRVSLARLDPGALRELRATGRCSFGLSEALFDRDFPGHHRRRIKSVAVSIPSVKGPYARVPCVLRLMSGRKPVQAVVETVDPGAFELDFEDERHRPFEGAGVVSEWSLELPPGRADLDVDAISDVILHVAYTAREEDRPERRPVSPRPS